MVSRELSLNPELPAPVNEPLLSVIMAVHPSFIQSTRAVMIELSRQAGAPDPADWELLIVFDGDPEESLQQWQLLAIASPYTVRLLSTEHTGKTGDAQRDFGISRAHGKYVAFLDDDDQPAPWYLSVCLSIAKSGLEIVKFLMLRDGWVFGLEEEDRRGTIGGGQVVVRRDIASVCEFNTRPGPAVGPGHDDYATDWFFIESCLGVSSRDTIKQVPRVCLFANSFKSLRPSLRPE